MSVKVVIPTPLRQYTEKRDNVVVEGQTVEEVLRMHQHHGSFDPLLPRRVR